MSSSGEESSKQSRSDESLKTVDPSGRSNSPAATGSENSPQDSSSGEGVHSDDAKSDDATSKSDKVDIEVVKDGDGFRYQIWEDSSDGCSDAKKHRENTSDDGKESGSSHDGEAGCGKDSGSGSQDGKSSQNGSSSQDERKSNNSHTQSTSTPSVTSNGPSDASGKSGLTKTSGTSSTVDSSNAVGPPRAAGHPTKCGHYNHEQSVAVRKGYPEGEDDSSLQMERDLEMDARLAHVHTHLNPSTTMPHKGQRTLRFGRPPPVWVLPMGPLSPSELRKLTEPQEDDEPATVMLAPATALRGPKDLADLVVAAGFVFDSSARNGINSVRLPRCDRANRSIGQGYIQCRSMEVAELIVRHLAGTLMQSQDGSGEAAYSAQCGLVATRSYGTLPQTRLKLEWKSVVAPSQLQHRQNQVTYEEADSAQRSAPEEHFWHGEVQTRATPGHAARNFPSGYADARFMQAYAWSRGN